MFYKVTLGFTTGATYNMTNVHVFKAAQARRAYFYSLAAPTSLGCRAFFFVQKLNDVITAAGQRSVAGMQNFSNY